jgi:hypothetical protein
MRLLAGLLFTAITCGTIEAQICTNAQSDCVQPVEIGQACYCRPDICGPGGQSCVFIYQLYDYCLNEWCGGQWYQGPDCVPDTGCDGGPLPQDAFVPRLSPKAALGLLRLPDTHPAIYQRVWEQWKADAPLRTVRTVRLHDKRFWWRHNI